MRLDLERNIAVPQRFMRLTDIIDFEIECSAKFLILGLLPDAEHEPDIAASEECETGRRAEQMFQAECVAVKGYGFVEVIYRKRDLSDLVQGNHAGFLQLDTSMVNA